MNCPRCGEKNQNKVCSNCGLKLLITCPECKTLNKIGQEKCSDCNFALIIFCPQCKAPNHPKGEKCRKCGHILNNSQKKYTEKNFTQNHAILTIELINFASLKASIDTDLSTKLQKKFYQIVIFEAKKKSEIVKKKSDEILIIEFKNANSTKMSAAHSIATAQRILETINQLNYKLKERNLDLKVKAGISTANAQNIFSKNERFHANINDIVVSADLYNLVSDMFDFAEIKSEPENPELNLYKLNNSMEQEIIEQEYIPQEELEKKQQETSKAKIKITENGTRKNVSQEEAYETLITILTKEKRGCITELSGADGVGKSTVILSVRQNIPAEKFTWLTGLCQPANMILPFAFFQDILKTIFNLPPIILNTTEAKKTVSCTLEAAQIRDKNVENILYTLLFQEGSNSDISNIFDRQLKVFQCIETIFAALYTKNSIILLIEDFEFIDSTSLDCIKYLIDKSFLNHGNQVIITHSSGINFDDYFLSSNYDNRIIKLDLMPLTWQDMDKALLGMLNNQDIIPVEFKDKIFAKAKGLPIYIEQLLWLFFQNKTIYSENDVLVFNGQTANIELPENTEDILKIRLSNISYISPDSLIIILYAGLFGQRFMPVIIQLMSGKDEQYFAALVQILFSNGIIVNFDEYTFLFKHKIIWKTIYNLCLLDIKKAEYHSTALEILKKYTNASSIILGLHAESANNPDEAIDHWNHGATEAALVGDVQAYTSSQKQILSLLEKVILDNESDRENIKNYIYEQIGKVNYKINPQEAVKYLSNAIIYNENKNNIVQVIELTGFLSKSCELTGNYNGIIECVDKALSKINQEEMPIEYSVLCYSKLDALYNLGRCEEVINLSRNFIPTLNQYVLSNSSIQGLDNHNLAFIAVDTELILAKALAIQGNKDSIDTAESVASKAKESGFTNIIVKAKLTEALFKTLQGRTKSANTVLENLRNSIPQIHNNDSFKLYSGFIDMLSGIFSGNYAQSGKLCHSLLALAEEYKEYSFQVIIKLIMTRLLKEAGNADKAKTLYNELIIHCSEYKMATGALFGWYLITEAEIHNGNLLSASEIAQKALEVAQKPNINNYLFTVLLQGLLAEIYMHKGDFESAKMYIEQAVELAKKMELYLLQSKLYIIYGKILQENMATAENNQDKIAASANKFYVMSLDVAKMIENGYLVNIVQKKINDLNTFCNLLGMKMT